MFSLVQYWKVTVYNYNEHNECIFAIGEYFDTCAFIIRLQSHPIMQSIQFDVVVSSSNFVQIARQFVITVVMFCCSANVISCLLLF